jgi:membrane protein implicated in regulation of membrane protease activity
MSDQPFLPTRPKRFGLESIMVRVVATAGVIGIATAVAAIMGASDSSYWLTGLIVSTLSVILAAVLWRSRQL